MKKKKELTDEEKIELKKNFRKATTMCHPDKVTEEQKEEAQRVFIELKKAYDEHDIAKVNQILNDLEKGKSFDSNSDISSEKEKLQLVLKQLKRRIEGYNLPLMSRKWDIIDYSFQSRVTGSKLLKENLLESFANGLSTKDAAIKYNTSYENAYRIRKKYYE